jgi:hypothetical protein
MKNFHLSVSCLLLSDYRWNRLQKTITTAREKQSLNNCPQKEHKVRREKELYVRPQERAYVYSRETKPQRLPTRK